MKLKNLSAFISLAAVSLSMHAQKPVAHFDMSIDGNQLEEIVTGTMSTVESQLPVCTVESPDGQAWRLDGYSNFVKAYVPSSSFSTEQLRVCVVLAAESYPMMRVEDAEMTPSYGLVCGNIDETSNKGFALELSSQGTLRFRFASATGGILSITSSSKLPLGQWCEVTMLLNKSTNAATLYVNGQVVGSGRMGRAALNHGSNDFYIGKSATELKSGPFHINTFCGLIDDIAVFNDVSTPQAVTFDDAPDFKYPTSRYDESYWRPQYHAMPTGSWTNETHGMIYSGGRYHLFFQKNANGPYMARLHWGHLSSEDLCHWTEQNIAIAPGESYDLKGCWSGCIYEDNGTPTLLYTAVDNSHAVIAKATSSDEDLLDWQKQGVVINGRPSGLSDDFRDPYHFEANGQQYVIVGTGKNGIGACTLHKYQNGTWSNDGSIFFQGSNVSSHGTFWEMPNVTPMGNGKWLFTCTPLNASYGVRTLYWVGTIGSDGKFTPDASTEQYLEMSGVSRMGYGLLSPTICQQGNKTLLLGIVPDKLSTEQNFLMGWAHTYSLPREIALSSTGTILQKPFEGLTALRTATSFSEQLTLNGTQSLSPVGGRQIELLGEFTVGASGTMGFNFLKSGERQVSLTYNTRGRLILDMSKLTREVNDKDIFNGIYAVALPEKVVAGDKLKLHVFLDGSILDIFVNDKWAYSVRLFPTAEDEIEAEVFSSDQVTAQVSAWILDGSHATGIYDIAKEKTEDNRYYDLQGRQLQGKPQRGLYILNGRKYVAR